MSSFRRPQTVRHYTGGYYSQSGEWIPGGFTTASIMASVQPINTQERQHYTKLLPEGAEQYDVLKVYSSTPLTPERQDMTEADVLLWRGREWKIVLREDWQSGVINHFRHVAVEVRNDGTSEEAENP